jgi:hypothetical protein
MDRKYKIPMIPCHECLIKPMCRSRLREGIMSLSLSCSILDEWLKRDTYGNANIRKLEITYNELWHRNIKKGLVI